MCGGKGVGMGGGRERESQKGGGRERAALGTISKRQVLASQPLHTHSLSLSLHTQQSDHRGVDYQRIKILQGKVRDGGCHCPGGCDRVDTGIGGLDPKVFRPAERERERERERESFSSSYRYTLEIRILCVLSPRTLRYGLCSCNLSLSLSLSLLFLRAPERSGINRGASGGGEGEEEGREKEREREREEGREGGGESL